MAVVLVSALLSFDLQACLDVSLNHDWVHSCISDCVSPSPLSPSSVSPLTSSSFLLGLYPLAKPGDGYHTHSPLDLTLAKLNTVLSLSHAVISAHCF